MGAGLGPWECLQVFEHAKSVAVNVVTAIAVVAFFVGCSSGAAREGLEPVGRWSYRRAAVEDLQQSAVLSRDTVAPGDSLTVRWTAWNTSDDTLVLKSRYCGVDIQGVSFARVGGTCFTHAMEGPLSPGDSIGWTEWIKITSSTGTYELHIRGVLIPEIWSTATLAVVPSEAPSRGEMHH